MRPSVVGHGDAACGQHRDDVFRPSFGAALGEVAFGELALIFVTSVDHECLEGQSSGRWQRRDDEIRVQRGAPIVEGARRGDGGLGEGDGVVAIRIEDDGKDGEVGRPTGLRLVSDDRD